MTDGQATKTEADVTSVRKTITVDVDPERAFVVFTEDIDGWWARSHHIGDSEPFTVLIEPGAGGRWYERGADGSECDWGHVIAWEPPGRLVLAWQIGAGWTYDPDLVTTVEVTFTAEGAGRTRVDLEHRNLDRLGDAAPAMREAFDSAGGWTGLLAAYAERATG